MFILLVTHAGVSGNEITAYGPYTMLSEAETAQEELHVLLSVYVDVSMEIKPLLGFNSSPVPQPVIPYVAPAPWFAPAAPRYPSFPLWIENGTGVYHV